MLRTLGSLLVGEIKITDISDFSFKDASGIFPADSNKDDGNSARSESRGSPSILSFEFEIPRKAIVTSLELVSE